MVDTVKANNDFTDVNADGSDPNFDMKVKAFFFTGQENSYIHLWCEVTVCLQGNTDSGCVQNTGSDCSMVKRRRRRDADPRKKNRDGNKYRSPSESGSGV